MCEASTSCEEPIAKRLRRRKSPSPRPSTTRSNEDDQNESSIALNNDCIWEIFRYVDIETLCTMANVSKQFRAISEQIFQNRYKAKVIDTLSYRNGISTFRRILCKFGPLILSLNVRHGDYENAVNADEIAKYCQNLQFLRLGYEKIDCAATEPLFTNLKGLMIDSCQFTGNVSQLFANCARLEYLFFFRCDLKTNQNVLVHHFPNLNILRLDGKEFSHATFAAFLAKNPKLRCFCVDMLPNDECITSIVDSTPNLEVLEFQGAWIMSEPKNHTKDGLLKLARLTKLRKLVLNTAYNAYTDSVTPLLDAFANAKICMEHLTLKGFKINAQTIQILAKLRAIKTLKLDFIENITESDLMPLANELPSLKKLDITTSVFERMLGQPRVKMTSAFIDAIANAKILIDEFAVDGFEIDSIAVQSFFKLKSITTLCLNDNGRICESDLVLLAKHLPLLTDLEVSRISTKMSITVDELKRLIQSGNRLKRIKLGNVVNLHIDGNGFELLQNAVGRNQTLQIDFEGCKFTTSFTVPDAIKKSKQKRLNIMYMEFCTGCNQCNSIPRNLNA